MDENLACQAQKMTDWWHSAIRLFSGLTRGLRNLALWAPFRPAFSDLAVLRVGFDSHRPLHISRATALYLPCLVLRISPNCKSFGFETEFSS
jgi:hypothetical protein